MRNFQDELLPGPAYEVGTSKQNCKPLYHSQFRPMEILQELIPRRLQVCQNTVIPAQAGIQTEEFNPDSLDPCLRRGDGKTELANGVELIHDFGYTPLTKSGRQVEFPLFS